jgi:hydroxyacylglutathione hydrolase
MFPAERMYLTHFGRVEDVGRLVEDLRRRIGDHAEIAQSAREAHDRHQRILNDLKDYLLSELRDCNSATSPEQALSVYGMDLELNAQGLDVWLDRPR